MSSASDPAGVAGGDQPNRRMRIFRATDAVALGTDMMPLENVSETDALAMSGPTSPEEQIGAYVKVLFADEALGLSVAYSWFKPDFILPRHSHNADCAYYVISGEAHLGTEVLRAGDGFFIPAGGDYQYSAGPEGVEVLEFRTAAQFNMRLSGNSEAAWRRIAENAAANHQRWRSAPPPLAAARMMG
jgi:quercetin dioxygenase-like cupin family protein